jgi:titin
VSSNTQVLGNYIGTDITGHLARGNGGTGVSPWGDNNIIGGATTLARNIISANGSHGIDVFHQGATILGNYIGTDVDGTTDLGNHFSGINLNVSDGNVIGGAGAGNLISGNNNGGILIGLTDNTTVQGNLIGTKADGVSALGNAVFGVKIVLGSNKTIGGSTGNTIAFNTGLEWISIAGLTTSSSAT